MGEEVCFRDAKSTFSRFGNHRVGWIDAVCLRAVVAEELQPLATPGREVEDRSARVVLCVNNLSSRPQATTITVPEEFRNHQTRDLFGGTGFPDIGDDGRVTVTLGSRDFFWLALDPPRGEVRG